MQGWVPLNYNEFALTLWNKEKNFNEILKKDETYSNIKITKKPGLHPLSRKQIFGKSTGEERGSNWHPAV